VNTTAQIGAALGLAVLATLSASRSATLTAAGEGLKAALTGGYHLAFWVAAGLVGVSIAVAVFVLEPVSTATIEADDEAQDEASTLVGELV
jgi:hypothetical protein